MKKIRIFLPFLLVQTAFAQSIPGFMTPRDSLDNDARSNIYLRNNRNIETTVYGLYVRQYAYVNAGSSCDSATTIYTGNVTGGATVLPVVIGAGKSASLGSNFLYNMILTAIYYENIIIPSSPPGCALPGCTWGEDTVKYNWCIQLGALAPVGNTSPYTAKVPPSTDNASGVGYNYNLISTYVDLGPIACDDQALSCTVSGLQTQAFS